MNSTGGFNVPFGKYPKPTILDELNIWAVSKVLQKAEIKIAAYHECYDKVDNQSFVYFDPPYRPLSKTSSFTTYSGSEFGDKDQMFGSSNIVGFGYLPKGTLNPPIEFNLNNPLKHVLFRNINCAALSIQLSDNFL